MKTKEIWFITGSQDLYGPQTLKQVAADSSVIADALDKSEKIFQKIVFKPVLTSPGSIHKLCLEANNSENCIGLIAWMHTFSPAKMWINGLSILSKPFLHFHTVSNAAAVPPAALRNQALDFSCTARIMLVPCRLL